MAVRQSSVLKEHGFKGSQVDFRRTLAEVKAACYPDLSDEELSYTRDEADAYCVEIRRRTGMPTLQRTFILRSLIGVRKHPVKV